MKCKGLWEGHDLVFPSSMEILISHNNLNRRHFKPLLKKAGLPAIKPYGLRHTFATLWFESGEHLKTCRKNGSCLDRPHAGYLLARRTAHITGGNAKVRRTVLQFSLRRPLWYG